MISLNSVLALVCLLNAYSYAANCGDRQTEINGRCCDLCPPGKYLKEFCSEQQQTVCVPCEEGHYSALYNIFDRCEECLTCQGEYDRKCTATTDAQCSCRPGFLCSNHVCSECETERKCEAGDKLKRTGLRDYSYKCEPACPNNTYLDTHEDICKPLTPCSVIGLPVLFPGNKTHNSLCHISVPGTHSTGASILLILGIGLVLFSFALLVFLCYVCVKSCRRDRAKYRHPMEILATYTCELQLSREESGMRAIQDELKESNSIH